MNGSTVIGKLKVVRGGFGNYRSYKLVNNDGKDLIKFEFRK